MNSSNDNPIICALLDHYEKHTMPRMMDIKQQVDAGEKLNDADISFLQNTFAELHNIEPLIHRHPEYQVLFSRMVDFCKDISLRAAANEDSK